MGTKPFIAVCGLVVALLAAAGGMYAYDSSRDDLIAEGMRVGGVDVGGMRADAASARLREALLTPLRQPVTLAYGTQRFTLTSEQARVGVDIDRSVAAAIARSRRGNLLTRTARAIAGGEIHAELPVDVTYDRDMIDRLVLRVRQAIERPAVDATVDFHGGNVTPRPSKTGVRVQRARLRREIVTELTAFDAERSVRVRTSTVRPKVSTDDLADRYPAVVIVDRKSFRLTLYKDLRPRKTYRIAIGQVGLETPAGLYHVQNKAINPAWHVPDSDWAGKLKGKVIPPDDPRNPIEARWMGIYDGAGIHGTTAINSLGTAASHGCIRMAIPDVIELFDEVPVQAPVYIR
jgi:lipoprotein-anchoring transpeptidase ErfK/SrfK